MPLGGAATNQTLLLALLDRCRQVVLKDVEMNHQETKDNSSGRNSYDNAYFYILFVMIFYSFLALALLKGFAQYETKKKDPYEEFKSSSDSSRKKCNAANDKTDLEEENYV